MLFGGKIIVRITGTASAIFCLRRIYYIRSLPLTLPV